MTEIRAMVMVSDFASENINTDCLGTNRKRKPSEVLLYCGKLLAMTRSM
jgi:hypothetical protein